MVLFYDYSQYLLKLQHSAGCNVEVSDCCTFYFLAVKAWFDGLLRFLILVVVGTDNTEFFSIIKVNLYFREQWHAKFIFSATGVYGVESHCRHHIPSRHLTAILVATNAVRGQIVGRLECFHGCHSFRPALAINAIAGKGAACCQEHPLEHAHGCALHAFSDCGHLNTSPLVDHFLGTFWRFGGRFFLWFSGDHIRGDIAAHHKRYYIGPELLHASPKFPLPVARVAVIGAITGSMCLIMAHNVFGQYAVYVAQVSAQPRRKAKASL